MSPASEHEHTLLTKQQTAEQLCVSTRTVERWTADGLLTAVVVGKRSVRFRQADVNQLRWPR